MTTIRAILFGDVVPTQAGSLSQTVDAAAQRLADAGAFPQRDDAPPIALARTVINKVVELLNTEVGQVVVGAWRTRSALLVAARESLQQPGTHREVTVQSFSFPWEYAVDVDLTLNRVTIATASFSVSAAVEVTALAATIHDGRITRLSSGELTISAALWVTSRTAVPIGVPLAEGDRTVQLAVELVLPGEGLSLVDRSNARTVG
jgi:hypothetical protein